MFGVLLFLDTGLRLLFSPGTQQAPGLLLHKGTGRLAECPVATDNDADLVVLSHLFIQNFISLTTASTTSLKAMA
jgi:hypothetical protein